MYQTETQKLVYWVGGGGLSCSSGLDLLKDFCFSGNFLRASMAGARSRGLTNFFSTSSNLAVAHGAVPTVLAELGPSIVSDDAS
ncbi:hypothetical protein Hanom_Chr13g01214801 [Helianthus anomalus]